MSTQTRNFWQVITRQADVDAPEKPKADMELIFEISPNDALMAYSVGARGLIHVDKLKLESPALEAMKTAGVKLALPMISHGEIVGMLNLGPRMSEQEYNPDDVRLLENLALQAAPALRVAQLARQQQIEALERERIQHELKVARLIQHTLLPKDVPKLPGWQVATYYQPARAVGGDFYDFIYFDDGRVAIIIGDVTDKGVPAALVMATTRSILRGAAQRLVSPGKVLERTNELLQPDIPPNMFVTCLYAVLDPEIGCMQYANAGHDLPYRRGKDSVDEMRATGMPLGLMPDMTYEEKEITLEPGDSILFYSDGLVEAHNAERDMFGFPRLQELMAGHPGGAKLIGYLLDELHKFTGADWEQEDDVTFVTLQRTEQSSTDENGLDGWRSLGEFSVQSEQGNERQVMEQVAETVQELSMPEAQLERLKTAVAEATMNAMEHGNQYRSELPVSIRVLVSEANAALAVHITDMGGGDSIIDAETPDLEAKLDGTQTPRGWGLFLIKNMVDEMHIRSDEKHHTVELIMNLKGDDDDS